MKINFQISLRITLWYIAFSAVWILFSDQLLASFIFDPIVITQFQTIKGLLFVITSASFIFFLLYRELKRRKEIEEALKSSEARWRTLFENAPAYILRIDLEGKILSANRGGYGLTVEDAVGTNIYDWPTMNSIEVFKENLEQIRKTGKSIIFEAETTQLDKKSRWFRSQLGPIMVDDEIESLILITNEITEQKQSEEQLRTLSRAVEQSSTSVLLTDIHGNIEYVNPQFTELTGYTSQEVLGKNPRILKSGKMSQKLYEELWETISSGEEWHGEFYNKKKNGDFFWVSASISPLKNMEGEITHFLGIEEDVSKRKRAENIQKVLFHIAQASNETENLEALLRTVRQEIGTLMNTTNFYVALYDEESDAYSFPFWMDEHDDLPSPHPQRLNNSLTDYVRKTGKPLLADDASLQRLAQEGEFKLRGVAAPSWLGIPLKTAQKVIGIVVVQSYSEDVHYTERDLELMSVVAENIASAIERKWSEEKLQRKTIQSEALVRTAAHLNAQLDLDAVLTTVCKETIDALKVSAVNIDLYDDQQEMFYCAAYHGMTPDFCERYLPIPRTLYDGYVQLQGPLIVLPDVQIHNDLINSNLYADLNVRSTICASMMRENHLIGTLNIYTFDEVRHFSDDELELVKGLAHQAALAISNVRLLEKTKRQLSQVQALRTIDLAISGSFELSLTLNVILEQIKTHLEVDAADILLFNPHTLTLEHAASDGFSSTAITQTRLRLGEGFAGRSALERQMLCVGDLSKEPTDLIRDKLFEEESYKAYACIPLFVKRQLKGV